MKKYDEKIKEAIDLLINEEDESLCEELICDQNVKSSLFAEAAFKNNIYNPRILYKNASEEIRDELINILDSNEIDENTNINGILIALAEIGDDIVFKKFKEWQNNPKKWRKKLYIGPDGYAFEGGFCIEDGKYKKLTYDKCFAIKEGNKNDVKISKVSKDKCPCCNSSYVNILELDGKDERLGFLNINGRIKIKTCTSCLPWEEFIFCGFKEDEESTIIEMQDGAGDEIDDESLNISTKYEISENEVSEVYCDEFEKSAIGGKPSFIADAHYATCPVCKKKMKHLAQLSSNITRESGTIYIQICPECKVAATLYQQT